MTAKQYAQALIDSGRFTRALAIHIAARDFNISTREVSKQLREQKSTKTRKKEYQSTVPAWMKDRD